MTEYIKREDIINWIDDSLELCGNRYSTEQENMMELFRTVVNDCLPFADVVERKRGKWIKIKYRSICRDCSFRGFASWNFCPNCGADMRGEQDG